MSKYYLDPKTLTGVEPAADMNVEAVGPSCLDVNTILANEAKGRGGGVWGTPFLMLAIDIIMFLFFFLINRMPLGSVFITLIPISLVCTVPGLFYIYVWRTHLPARFCRATRKVYYHRRGKTYITDWDSIRAHLDAKKSVLANGTSITYEVIGIEFPDEGAKTYMLWLPGTKTAYSTNMDAQKALWEYIRIYMEDGPEGLPPPELRGDYIPSPKENLKKFNPFPKRPKQWWRWPLEIGLFYPLRTTFYLMVGVSDFIYYYLAPHLKVKPFPAELTNPCLCNETEKQREQRIATVLATYNAKIPTLVEDLSLKRHMLLKLYHAWFADFKPYGVRDGSPELSQPYKSSKKGEINFLGSVKVKLVKGVPEGWQRFKLIDLVELNPTYHGMTGKKLRQIPMEALPRAGLFLEGGPFDSSPASSLSNICRNDDTLFPAAAPWLTQAEPAFVHELVSDELAACPEAIIVMRARKVSPAFVYGLASSQALRDYAQRHIIETPQGPRISLEALANFEVLMPPPNLFMIFENNATPYLYFAAEAARKCLWLRRARERLIASCPSLIDKTSATIAS